MIQIPQQNEFSTNENIFLFLIATVVICSVFAVLAYLAEYLEKKDSQEKE